MSRTTGMAEALGATDDGVLLSVMVTPNAADPGLRGYNPWRRRVEVRVGSPARRSRANDELVELLARLMGVGRADVAVVYGGTSHEKTVRISGRTVEEVLARLEDVLGGKR